MLKDQKIGVVNEILIWKDCSSSSNPNIRKVIDAFELFNTKFHEIYSKMSDEEKMDYMNGALNTNLSILLSNPVFHLCLAKTIHSYTYLLCLNL